MLKRKIILAVLVCVSTVLFVNQTLSQTKGAFGDSGQPGRSGMGSGNSSGQSRRVQSKETDETKAQSFKGAVGVTDEQWEVIKAKLDKIKKLREVACMRIGTAGGDFGGSQSRAGNASGSGMSGGAGGSGFGGPLNRRTGSETKTYGDSWMQWTWYKAWAAEGAQREDEKLCDGLFDLLQNNNADEGRIRRKMEALRKARQDTRKKLTKAEQELREALTIDQQARMLVLGWLD